MDWLKDFANFDNEIFVSLLKVLIIILVLVIINHFGRRLITKIVREAISPDKFSSAQAEKKREDTLISIFGTIIKTGLWIFGPMLILAQLGVNIGPLIAGASIAGIAIGFGAQKIVQDFVSGILIILENQYRIGDVITIANTTGTVEKITIRQTIIRDLEGKRHYISNGQIDISSNHTIDYANLVLNMDISYDADIDRVQAVINQVGQELAKAPQLKDRILKAPEFIRIQEFGAHSVVVRIMGQVKPGQQWSIAGELRLKLKKAFDEAGIEIPYQQLVIHNKKA
ncbi:MAG: mechanosensitive ion channel family protein [Candidatus Saccharibacteria bacterium]|nr:mechanosensitive ion channel family protein [Candidatus Saccharibacteria bacterium]